MYEQHFGLKKRPFRANAIGTDVFVGPHIAATMAAVKKALTTDDAVIAVSGPVGSGKTTLVNRALESTGQNQKTILIPRMRLDSNDVLDMLLDELGVEDKPNGTIQRFALFRRHLKTLSDSGIRVFVAIEDAVRLGADTLAEVEALTAADAGEGEGACLVLMGDGSLDTLLRESSLARMQQRTRQRLNTAALPLAELRGYLRHCFRLAGGDFERIFEANAAELVHHLSAGIPRVANNIVESAMAAAAGQDVSTVTSAFIARVAENEYGLSAADFEPTPSQKTEPVDVPVVESVIEQTPLEPQQIPELIPVLEAEEAQIPELAVDAPVIVFAEPKIQAETDSVPVEVEIPELFQDTYTLPDLAILAPELALAAVSEPVAMPVPVPVPEAKPDLVSGLTVVDPLTVAESAAAQVPDWDRDSTMAELRPDLAALEQAMAFAQSDDPKPAPVDKQEALPKPEPVAPEVIPEITLDNAISQRIESNLIDEQGEISAPAPSSDSAASKTPNSPTVSPPSKTNKKADTELEKIAIELAKAKSLEDVDDKMAETLFGDEINFVAAEILANLPSDESANDEHESEVPEQAEVATSVHAVNGEDSGGVKVILEAPRQLDDGGMDLSASQRLKTVRELNANSRPSIRAPEAVTLRDRPQETMRTPDSIEDQITSLTQTLKALDVAPPVLDDDDGPKGGFFSRFKRS